MYAKVHFQVDISWLLFFFLHWSCVIFISLNPIPCMHSVHFVHYSLNEMDFYTILRVFGKRKEEEEEELKKKANSLFRYGLCIHEKW